MSKPAAQFPPTQKFYPSKKKWWIMLFFSLLMCHFTYTQMRAGESIGYLNFGSTLLMMISLIIPNLFSQNNYLSLSPTGFEIKSMSGKYFYYWSDITEVGFTVTKIIGQKYLAYYLTEQGNLRIKDRHKTDKSPLYIHAIYGSSAEDLAVLMNGYLAKTLKK